MAYESLSSIQPGSLLADAAYSQLSEAILRNELPPGTSLSVPELSRRLEISRSPVREAVQRLVYDGLADYRGRRGTVVSSIDIADFIALLEVREVLEGLAAGLAAERAADDELAELERHHHLFLAIAAGAADTNEVTEATEAGAATETTGEFVELDMGFHRLIRRMSHNDELAMLLGRTQARAHLSMHSLWSGGRNIKAAQDEHDQICGAILARDPTLASTTARGHIEGLRLRILSESGSESGSESASG